MITKLIMTRLGVAVVVDKIVLQRRSRFELES